MIEITHLNFTPKYDGCCRSERRSDTVYNVSWTVPTGKVYHTSISNRTQLSPFWIVSGSSSCKMYGVSGLKWQCFRRVFERRLVLISAVEMTSLLTKMCVVFLSPSRKVLLPTGHISCLPSLFQSTQMFSYWQHYKVNQSKVHVISPVPRM